MIFSEYIQIKMNDGSLDLSLSEAEFVKNCKKRFGIGGQSSKEFHVWYGFDKYDFAYEQIIDGQKVTMFAGSWKELYHLLRRLCGVEDKQLTLW